MNRKFFGSLALSVTLTLLALPARAATFDSNRPSTTNNDDSCDIAVLPAATLLLPYFEVEFETPVSVATTTIFTIINTSRFPQIARVTAWTDRGYPVFNFNVFLTGYDVQALNLYDLLARGVIAPERGTSNANTPGSRSLLNGANTNFLPTAQDNCGRNSMPVQIPANILSEMQAAFSNGTVARTCGTTQVGGQHRRGGNRIAVGYVTVDLVATCGFNLPTQAAYYNEILYDNVLTGDYDVISPNPATGNYAGGNPLVHIRAIPEGGLPGVNAETSLPYTFYDRVTPNTNRRMDRRQPLPATFAARYIQGGPSAFNTDFQIWREPLTGPGAECNQYLTNNRSLTDIVRFDERENPTTGPIPLIVTDPIGPLFPSTSRIASSNVEFPPLTSGDLAGWMYFNLNVPIAQLPGGRPTQNWVSTNMAAEGRFSVMMDATMLGNGCTPARGSSSVNNPIGPASNN